MRETAPTEAVECTIDGGQEAIMAILVEFLGDVTPRQPAKEENRWRSEIDIQSVCWSYYYC